jgi:predicted dinucleotide-binding enzyme
MSQGQEMKITIIGAGNVGGVLGAKWAAAGHDVCFGVRDPESDKVRRLLQRLPSSASAKSLAEAADFGDLVVFAVPGKSVARIVEDHHAALDGKIIVDASNNTTQSEWHNLGQIGRTLPRAVLFRAFNHLGWENFANPDFGRERADLFFCGQEGPGRAVLEELIDAIGLRPVYVGGVESAGLLDHLTRLWFTLSRTHGRHMAFRMIT